MFHKHFVFFHACLYTPCVPIPLLYVSFSVHAAVCGLSERDHWPQLFPLCAPMRLFFLKHMPGRMQAAAAGPKGGGGEGHEGS